jgi:hypothetical protein
MTANALEILGFVFLFLGLVAWAESVFRERK